MEAPKEIYIQPDAQDRWFKFLNTLPNCTKYIRADLAELTWEDMRDIIRIAEGLRNENEIFGYPFFYKEILKRFNELKKK